MINGYYLSDNRDDMDLHSVYRFISSTYWAEGIPIETMEKAINNSLCFGVFTHTNIQVGFARVVTDQATFAYLCDVFIEESHRGLGLSKWLVQYVHGSPSLKGLRRFVLVTRDAHKLYSDFGYTPLNNPEGFMENWNPEVYRNT